MNRDIVCTLCEKPLEADVDQIDDVLQKGLETFITKSKAREDNKWKCWTGESSVRFHRACRKRYSGLASKPPSKKRRTESTFSEFSFPSTSELPSPSPSTSNNNCTFNFTDLCFICGHELDRIHKTVRSVQHKYFQNTLIDFATQKDDEEGKSFINRLQGVTSLVDLKASYHKKCYDKFIRIPSKEPRTPIINIEAVAMFEDICNYIEQSGKFKFLLSDLRKIMGDKGLDNKVLFRKLQEKYRDEIYVHHRRGKEPMIYYKTFDLSKMCNNWFCDENSLGDIEKKTILTVAAEILRSEVLKSTYHNEEYPPPNKFLENVVSDIPELLTVFLRDLLLDKKTEEIGDNAIKRAFVSHAIVSIIRPRSFISTLQLATGIYIYRKTGSRLIVDLLSKLGACSSYYNIQLHEASTIMDPPETIIEDETFVQFVFDNTDHNVATLDGRETFHCLGGIAVYTPEDNISYVGGSKKLRTMPSASLLAKQKRIPILPCGDFNPKAMEAIRYVPLKSLHLKKPPVLSPSYAVYLSAKSLGISKVPLWRGFMEILSRETEYKCSQIVCLPFINSLPSNSSTLTTSLHYAAAESKKIGQTTCFVTYDQPLYWKARCIVAQSTATDGALRNVVVRLGTFHTLMSYLGSIGYVMDGSGLEDLWAEVYAPGSVKKMLTGHAFSRAVRAHILTFTVIGIMICKKIDTSEEWKASTEELLGTWSKVSLTSAQSPQMDDLTDQLPQTGDCNIEPIREMVEKFEKKLEELEKSGPTAKLWVQYFRSVAVVLQVIEAERLGNWNLHLQSIQQMLPLFHAAGHFPYAKSAQVYLQDMIDLERDPDKFHDFTENGYFTIHRTDKAWSGIFSDMTIEQTLNRFFGTDLKHGRGVTPSVMARYLLAMPSAFSIMECLEDYSMIRSSNSEQHVELSASRTGKDEKDIKQMLSWLEKRNPWDPRTSLTSLSTRIIGGSQINCHMAIENGLQAMDLMIGKNAANISLSAVYKVKNLATAKDRAHIDKESVEVDTFLLFQKISVFFKGNPDLTRLALTYELSPFPLSLFDERGFMRKTQKSELYKSFTPYMQNPSVLEKSIFVIDGGWLIHHVVWPHTQTYGDIFEIYKSYIVKHFGENARVVFDGYNNEIIGTKSYERYRRKEKFVDVDVDISEDNLVVIMQTKFLSNVANKYKFVALLSQYLQRNSIDTKIATEDADKLIVETAIELKKSTLLSVTVVGNDVDLLVLLTALTPATETIYFQKIVSKGKKGNTIFSTSCQRKLRPFILFAHAFSGCDTTNAIYKKGKKNIISILEKNEDLQDLISIFYLPNKTIDDLYAVAEKLIMNLYSSNEHQTSSIDDLRYNIFNTSIGVAKKGISLALLPPTVSALRQHVKRVYYQIQQWLGHYLSPEDWGWKRINVMLIPIMSNQDPAPKELLEKISCSCSKDCSGNRCGCKKAGVHCSPICKCCNQGICKNSSKDILRKTGEAEEPEETEEAEPDFDVEDVGIEETAVYRCNFDDEETIDISFYDF